MNLATSIPNGNGLTNNVVVLSHLNPKRKWVDRQCCGNKSLSKELKRRYIAELEHKVLTPYRHKQQHCLLNLLCNLHHVKFTQNNDLKFRLHIMEQPAQFRVGRRFRVRRIEGKS